jgi:hypothetical protein
MSTQSESSKKARLERPADYYKSPEDITQDSELSPDEKRQALNTWEQDARQMMTASNEGMEGDDDPLREIRVIVASAASRAETAKAKERR